MPWNCSATPMSSISASVFSSLLTWLAGWARLQGTMMHVTKRAQEGPRMTPEHRKYRATLFSSATFLKREEKPTSYSNSFANHEVVSYLRCPSTTVSTVSLSSPIVEPKWTAVVSGRLSTSLREGFDNSVGCWWATAIPCGRRQDGELCRHVGVGLWIGKKRAVYCRSRSSHWHGL